MAEETKPAQVFELNAGGSLLHLNLLWAVLERLRGSRGVREDLANLRMEMHPAQIARYKSLVVSCFDKYWLESYPMDVRLEMARHIKEIYKLCFIGDARIRRRWDMRCDEINFFGAWGEYLARLYNLGVPPGWEEFRG